MDVSRCIPRATLAVRLQTIHERLKSWTATPMDGEKRALYNRQADTVFRLDVLGSSPLLCLVGATAPRPSEHQRGTGKQMEWYELKGHPMDAALPPLQVASEEAALGTFARELNLSS